MHSSRICWLARWRLALSYWPRLWPGAARNTDVHHARSCPNLRVIIALMSSIRKSTNRPLACSVARKLTISAPASLACSVAALEEHFRIRPLREESEGSTVQVAAGYPVDEYRLLGKIRGPAPFSGVLVHHGWKTDTVKLPRIVRSSTNRLPAIAPAEVELK
jgi:Domain of unknown function (DUF2760)